MGFPKSQTIAVGQDMGSLTIGGQDGTFSRFMKNELYPSVIGNDERAHVETVGANGSY